MRTKLELLQLLMDIYTNPEYKHFTDHGMIYATRMMLINDIITRDERNQLLDVIDSERTTRKPWFPEGWKEPRIEWIKSQIEFYARGAEAGVVVCDMSGKGFCQYELKNGCCDLPAGECVNQQIQKGIKLKKMIDINSLEIFRTNRYNPTDIGMVSDNAYLSIIVTNNCQMKCSYCINSLTDHSLELPIDKAIGNIRKLVDRYGVKEAILLGGEPLLHSDLFTLIKRLRHETGLKMIRLTTNGIRLKQDGDFIKKLVNPKHGIQGVNISYHNEDFISYFCLKNVVNLIKSHNPNIKVRINTNVWKGNNDRLTDLTNFLNRLYFVDEIRVSNIIPKDSFSVNSKNNEFIGLSVKEYDNLFQAMCDHYGTHYLLIDNKKTLGFVRYILVGSPVPIIINWNTYSTVSEQICENNIKTREINTFKCLVNGDISLSWNNSNTILL